MKENCIIDSLVLSNKNKEMIFLMDYISANSGRSIREIKAVRRPKGCFNDNKHIEAFDFRHNEYRCFSIERIKSINIKE